MEWWQIIIAIVSILGVGFLLAKIWTDSTKNRKKDFWEDDVNYQDWGQIEGLEPVDDWDKKKELD